MTVHHIALLYKFLNSFHLDLPVKVKPIMAEFPPPALKQAAQAVATLLRERNETLSVAETAAGGLISAALLSQPGTSRVYKGGATLYTLESRIAFAGWSQANIDNYDGPNPELVAGLARHVRGTLGSTYTVGEVCFTPPLRDAVGRGPGSESLISALCYRAAPRDRPLLGHLKTELRKRSTIYTYLTILLMIMLAEVMWPSPW